MARHGATHHFVSTVDDVAWITNLRGADVDYNPVFLAHLLIDATRATLFVGAGKVDAALAGRTRRRRRGACADYAQAARGTGRRCRAGSTLLIDPRRITLGLREQVPAGVKVIEAINPSTLAKSRKTAAEAAFIREAMAEDGAAMCEFYAWFEAALARGERITELTIDETPERPSAPSAPTSSACRSRVIAGFNANGAMPHYRATPDVARGDRGRRPAADRLRRPVPRRHHRHHARVADRHRQRRDEARLHAGAQGHDRA